MGKGFFVTSFLGKGIWMDYYRTYFGKLSPP
jgi:hypothetical protein